MNFPCRFHRLHSLQQPLLQHTHTADVVGVLVSQADAPPSWLCDLAALSESEQKRLATIRHQPSAHHFRMGRCVVRSLLGAALGLHPAEVRLSLSADGKPFLALPTASQPWHFNISHTGSWLGVVFSRQPVGLDLEQLQTGRDLDALVRRFFAWEEQLQYAALPGEQRSTAFTRAWACKEALLKGVGSGVRDLQNCAVECDPQRPAQVLRPVPNSGNWCLQTYDDLSAEGIAIAVAMQHNPHS